MTLDPLVKQLTAQRAETVELIERLRANVAAIVEGADLGAVDDEHDPEGATIGFERAQAMALLAQTQRRLGEIDAALARARSGAVAVCEDCGEPIDPARLAVRPTATRCVRCAQVRRR